MNKFIDYLFHHPRNLLAAIWSHVGHFFSDETYIKGRFYLLMGKRLDLKNPKTFSEKLQWLKLYDRRPEYTTMVDKYAVKDYVAKIIGDEYVIPTLGVWNKPENIEWDKLPNQFVLKTTHGGGSEGVVICKDKATFDRGLAIAKLNKDLKSDAYRIGLEWPYKNVPRRVLAEKYIEPQPDIKDLPDYKFFCFNGEPKYCQVISGRGTKMCIDFFDHEWNHLPFHEPKNYPFADIEPAKPKHFEQMRQFAATLSKRRSFVRIDFYNVKDKIFFGEITFFPTSGYGGFLPEEWDNILGEYINIEISKC